MIPPCALTGRCWRQFPDRLREHDRMPHQARKTGFGQPDSSRFARLEERAYTERPPLSRRLPDGAPSRDRQGTAWPQPRVSALFRQGFRQAPPFPRKPARYGVQCTELTTSRRNTVRLARSAMCGRSGVPVLPFPAPSARNPACPRSPCPRGLPFFISTMKLKRGVIMAENTRSPSILR